MVARMEAEVRDILRQVIGQPSPPKDLGRATSAREAEEAIEECPHSAECLISSASGVSEPLGKVGKARQPPTLPTPTTPAASNAWVLGRTNRW